MTQVWVASARAGRVDAEARAALGQLWRDEAGILLETCHRVELYGTGAPSAALTEGVPPGTRILEGRAAVEHMVTVALGLDSVVLAEDQVLFQLRSALDASRRRGELDSSLERLLDGALRAGRRGRSWLPAKRPSLADLALAVVPEPLAGRNVLIVGAGRIGELAARAAVAHGASVTVASRTPDRAEIVAKRIGVLTAAFDPGLLVERCTTVVVALGGPWLLSDATSAALVGGRGHVVDLSAPPAVPATLRLALGDRFHSVDQLADVATRGPREALIRRLRVLAATTVDEYLDWAARHGTRDAARQVTERVEQIRGRELAELWRRFPQLPEEQRAEIERMTQRLAARLLREPLERLGRDTDGDGERAARDLFGL